MSDKTLSSYAHNAKIVAVNGTVTLNGVVQTEAERNSIAQKAEQVVGSGHVVNKLKVEGAK
jgi:osmotically-inducible protein OsmY